MLLLRSSLVSACPLVRGLTDFNCDRIEKIVFTGDSIVHGVKDDPFQPVGGYVARLQTMLPRAQVVEIGVPGITSQRLYSAYRSKLRSPRGLTTKLSQHSDLFVIAVGTNDYWLGGGTTPGITVRNIKRLVKTIRSQLLRYDDSPPFVAVATLTPTVREKQALYVNEVNRLLLEYSSPLLPVYVRFDELDPLLLSDDGLHPSASGYDELAQMAYHYVAVDSQAQMRMERPDSDGDRVEDYFERVRYHSDPQVADTDGDGLTDGAEVLRRKTSPLSPDTDGDGVSDGDEVKKHTNPLDPTSFSPATLTHVFPSLSQNRSGPVSSPKSGFELALQGSGTQSAYSSK